MVSVRKIVAGMGALFSLNLAIIVGMVGLDNAMNDVFTARLQPTLQFDTPDLIGQRILVTGGNRGIGKAIVELLLDANATVSISSRRESSCVGVGNELCTKLGKDRSRFDASSLDMANIHSIEQFVATAKSKGVRYSSVVLNAGIAGVHARQANGLQPIFAVNYFGNIVLINRLMQHQLLTADAKIILVTSGAHNMGVAYKFNVDAEASMMDAMKLYGQSKLLVQTYFTSLAKNTTLSIYSWNPGPVWTSIGRKDVPLALYPTYFSMLLMFFIAPLKACIPVMYLLSSPSPLHSGEYLNMATKQSPHAATLDQAHQAWVVQQTHHLAHTLQVSLLDPATLAAQYNVH